MQERFAVIEDPGQQGYVKRKLCDILTMVMCAVICGLDELGTVVTYIRNRAAFFNENFGISSVPSKATFSSVKFLQDFRDFPQYALTKAEKAKLLQKEKLLNPFVLQDLFALIDGMPTKT